MWSLPRLSSLPGLSRRASIHNENGGASRGDGRGVGVGKSFEWLP